MITVTPGSERAIAGILARETLADRLTGRVAERVADALEVDAADLYISHAVRAWLDHLINRPRDLVTADVRVVRRPSLQTVARSHPGQGDVLAWSVYASVRVTNHDDDATDTDLYLMVVGGVVDLAMPL